MSFITGLIGSIIASSIIFQLLGGLIVLAAYILQSIGLYEMAKRRQISHAWFGWIPLLNFYLMGELINDHVFGIPAAKWILSLGSIVIGILSIFMNPDGLLINIISTAFYVYQILAYYTLYKIYRPDMALIFAISGLIISPLNSLWIFLVRKDQAKVVTY